MDEKKRKNEKKKISTKQNFFRHTAVGMFSRSRAATRPLARCFSAKSAGKKNVVVVDGEELGASRFVELFTFARGVVG